MAAQQASQTEPVLGADYLHHFGTISAMDKLYMSYVSKNNARRDTDGLTWHVETATNVRPGVSTHIVHYTITQAVYDTDRC